jgi:hypothetical protein
MLWKIMHNNTRYYYPYSFICVDTIRMHNWNHITFFNHDMKFIKDYFLAYSFHSIEELFSAESSQVVFAILSKFWYK